MTLTDLLLTVHVLSAAVWFGSGAALNVTTRRLLAGSPDAFATFVGPMNDWAGKAHPAAGVLLLVTGPAIVADVGYDWGEPWIIIAIVGLLVLMGLGGGLVGRTADGIAERVRGGDRDVRADAERLVRYMAIETLLIGLVIADMVIKPWG